MAECLQHASEGRAATLIERAAADGHPTAQFHEDEFRDALVNIALSDEDEPAVEPGTPTASLGTIRT